MDFFALLLLVASVATHFPAGILIVNMIYFEGKSRLCEDDCISNKISDRLKSPTVTTALSLTVNPQVRFTCCN